jgi:hypothetical protein
MRSTCGDGPSLDDREEILVWIAISVGPGEFGLV